MAVSFILIKIISPERKPVSVSASAFSIIKK
ncbi:hypothetical protein T01_13797 [Trichinella spiralis]|uniref:Uncharacterized protein n=1 Tax=Trichinella spiralis TaxID=6334 RepID=A0A0V0YS16_TRISP|nr:hypothetical protein T01_13797 [Trichinella spiralis]